MKFIVLSTETINVNYIRYMTTIYIVLLPTLVKYIPSKRKIETNLLPLV